MPRPGIENLGPQIVRLLVDFWLFKYGHRVVCMAGIGPGNTSRGTGEVRGVWVKRCVFNLVLEKLSSSPNPRVFLSFLTISNTYPVW